MITAAAGQPRPAPRPIDIVLVDDHAMLRQGLKSVLEREPDLRVRGEAATPTEAMEVVGRTRPMIVLLDLKLAGGTEAAGLDLCAALTSAYPDIFVLVLTTVTDDQLVMRAIQNGARGYVVKEVDTSELVQAIRAVSRGERAFDSRSAAARARATDAAAATATAPADHGRQLTDREREVLQLLARGMSNRDIGKKLFISETTAKFHVGNIMRKLQAARRAEAVYIASKTGLV
jgi:two-component system response regulator DevR